MATTLTIGAVDQTAFVGHQSMTCKLNTLDLTLVDPVTVPALGDAVALTDPTWAGTVVKVGTTDPVDRAGHVFVKIAATNSAAALASAAPFGLSDAPDNSTTYGYRLFFELYLYNRQTGTVEFNNRYVSLQLNLTRTS